MRLPSPGTREAIVKGALRLLSAKDFAEVTTRSIAETAHISEATLFRYFRRKEDILMSIMQEVAAGLFAELDQIAALVDGHAEKLLAVCRSHARWASRNRTLFALLQRECSYTGKKDAVCLDGLKKFLGTLQGFVEAGVRAGVFRKDVDVDTTVLAFWSVIHTVMMEDRILKKKSMDDEQFVRRCERFYQLYLGAIRTDKAVRA